MISLDKVEVQKEEEERQEKLKKIRNLHKPLDKTDFIKWDQEHKAHLDEVNSKVNK